jgi:hypothetical protein
MIMTCGSELSVRVGHYPGAVNRSKVKNRLGFKS